MRKNKRGYVQILYFVIVVIIILIVGKFFGLW